MLVSNSNMIPIKSLISLFLLLWPYTQCEETTKRLSRRVVQTKYGKLRGLLKEMPSNVLSPVEAYLGLQYASVLGKELRFLPPTSPMEQWTGVRVAIAHRPVCPQNIPDINKLNTSMPKSKVDHIRRIIPFLRAQHEDCLSLNIYVPTAEVNKTDAEDKKRPVVVFVHGETYDIGTGNAYDGSILASYGQVIVVTLNYRLGLFGFLSTGDHYAPGNYALMDIVAALQWLKENVAAFGGDAGNMSLMGHGHGAALVNLLMLSPVTAGGTLFKRGIVMSGSALATWAMSNNPRYYTKELAQLVNCSEYIEHSPNLLHCLRTKTSDELLKLSAYIRVPKYLSSFAPCILASSVLPESLEILFHHAAAYKSSLLVGTIKNEGYLFLNQSQLDTGLTQLEEHRIYRTYVNNIYKYHRQRIYDIIQHQYKDWDGQNTPGNIRDGVSDMLGDSQYIAPTIDLANRHTTFSKTYLYTFASPRASGLESVHGEDLAYVFGAPLTSKGLDSFPSTYTRIDRMLSESVMRYWTNFVKSGDPNLPTPQPTWHRTIHVKNKFFNVAFPQYTLKYQPYIHIAQRPDLRQRYRARQVALWLDLIPKVHRPDYPTTDGVEHLLTEHDNITLFLKDTRDVDLLMIMPPPPKTTPAATRIPNSKRTTDTPRTIAPWPYEIQTEKNPSARGIGGGSITADSPIALGIIIVVGAALLFLNVLVFAIVYYQRDKRRSKRDNKHRKTVDDEMEQRPMNLESMNHIQQNERTSSPVRINHVPSTKQQNSHPLHNNGGITSSDSLARTYDGAGKHAKFSATIWTYNADSDTKEPVTVV